MTGQPRQIVVIGSGLAGYGVLRELRKLAPEARLILVTGDDGHFYSKPALSTAFAKGKIADTLITTTAEKMAGQLRLDLRARCIVQSIDRSRQVLVTNQGPIEYDALVLALGADPIRPPLGGDAAEAALAVNHLDDYRKFRDTLPEKARVLIIGSGLVGTEFANDLSASGYSATVVDLLSYPLAQLVPPAIGQAVQRALGKAGVEWHFGRKVTAIDRAADGFHATLDDGSTIAVQAVLSAVGLRPHTKLAQEAGIAVGRGIKVDGTGRTSDPHIYAIGDCAEYPHGLSAYVTPIMAAARAIAPSLLGTPTAMKFPPLSVQVKTTSYPIALLPAPSGIAGRWVEDKADETGLRYYFRAADDAILGYALSGAYCAERADIDRLLSGAH